MSYQFGQRSKDNLSECHHDLQRLMNEAIKHMDLAVIEGYRTDQEQQKMLDRGFTKLGPGKSKHNRKPSLAVDVVPWPLDWNDRGRFIYMGGLILGIASQMGIKLRWGGDWNNNRKFDESFIDMPHFELVE